MVGEQIAQGFLVIVAVAHNKVVGYASDGNWRLLERFRQTVEHSVDVQHEKRSNGIGNLLMKELVARARDNDIHIMVACIEATNSGSLRLHQKLGFRTAGAFREVARKFECWLDLTCMELKL